MQLRLSIWLWVALIGVAGCGGAAMAQDTDSAAVNVVRPGGAAPALAPQLAPGGILVLRGGGAEAATASAPPPAFNPPPPAPVPGPRWHEYDYGGFDHRYDAGGFDRNFDRSGLSPP